MANNVTGREFIDIVFDAIRAKTQGRNGEYVNASEIFNIIYEAPHQDITERKKEIGNALKRLHEFKGRIVPQHNGKIDYEWDSFKLAPAEQIYTAIDVIARSGAAVETGVLVSYTGLTLETVESSLRRLLAQGRIAAENPLSGTGKDNAGEIISFGAIRLL